MKLSDIYLKKQRTVTVEFEGDSLTVTYKPMVITPAFTEEIAGVNGDSLRAFHERMILRLVADWEVLDEEGQRILPSEEFLHTLPIAFLVAVTDAIWNDIRPPSAQEKKD